MNMREIASALDGLASAQNAQAEATLLVAQRVGAHDGAQSDATGTSVESLTDAQMGTTAAILQVAQAIDRLAQAIEKVADAR